ncbi:MAG: VWA domain-containing protein [candidate division WOR-3 bacterium]
MIKWAQPQFLWFLLGLPVAAVLALVFAQMSRRRLHRSIDAELLPMLVPDRSPALVVLRTTLLFLALALLLLAAARPKWGEKLQLYKGKGIDVVIALDASKSMLAEDVKPNRLERAKTELAGLLDELVGNAVAICAFAGDCYVMCPLTTDVAAAKLFLDIINPEVMPVPGTDFGRAIDVALGLFNPREAGSRVLILVTDGEDLGRNTPAAIQRAIDAGVRIFPVAFSTPEGAPVPEKSERGVVYKKDKEGNVVISRLSERELIMMAQATGGRFLRTEGFSSQRLIEELDRLRKKEIGGGSFVEFVERFQPFLLGAFLFSVAALAISDRRGRWL